ncbi:MAG: glycerol-3-phosphate 1-O-acyltransferase PlsY [Phycisphaera sp.]|nr:MAG: glycerol-3-phosphate 1-O-acyltransferase PlsY [Phycisphaera sp.]
MLTALILAVAAYFIGGIPFGYLIARSKGVNILKEGSGNIGATNVKRVVGRGPGNLCFALDVAKGLLPTLTAGLILGTLGNLDAPPTTVWVWLLTPVATVLGHMFSPWLGFKGGKGVATGLGALLGVFWVLTLAVVGGLLVWLVVLKLSRYVGLASVCAAVSVPLWAALLPITIEGHLSNSAVPMLAMSGLLALLVVARHAGNLRRILAGTEPKIRSKAEKAAAKAQ